MEKIRKSELKNNYKLCFTCKHLYNPNLYGSKRSHTCNSCQTCKRICVCRQRAGIGTFYVPKAKPAAIGNSSMFVGSTRAIGLELELSSFGTWNVKEKMKDSLTEGFAYTIDHDGSVRPSQLEAVFAPMAGDQQVINGLNAIARQVWDHNCEVNDTCGYHVHVDARDFTWADIQKLLFAWMPLENNNNLWKLAGRGPTTFSDTWVSWWGKKTSNKPSLNLKKFKAQVINMLYNVDTSTYKDHINKVKQSDNFLQTYNNTIQWNKQHDKANRLSVPKAADYCTYLIEHKRLKANRGWNRAVKSRYLDLNIHSWLFRGTVEYRLAAGTIDSNDIRMWPLFCLWFTEIITRTSLKIIQRETAKGDLINTILKHQGFPIPSIMGEKIYPMAPFLLDWIREKIK